MSHHFLSLLLLLLVVVNNYFGHFSHVLSFSSYMPRLAAQQFISIRHMLIHLSSVCWCAILAVTREIRAFSNQRSRSPTANSNTFTNFIASLDSTSRPLPQNRCERDLFEYEYNIRSCVVPIGGVHTKCASRPDKARLIVAREYYIMAASMANICKSICIIIRV